MPNRNAIELVNAYRILGLKPGANWAAVKRAYRTLAFALHPDRNGGSQDATRKFQLLSQAYQEIKKQLKDGAPIRKQRRRATAASGPAFYSRFNSADLDKFKRAEEKFKRADEIKRAARKWNRLGLCPSEMARRKILRDVWDFLRNHEADRIWGEHQARLAEIAKAQQARRQQAAQNKREAKAEAARKAHEEVERRRREAIPLRTVYRRCGRPACHCMKPDGELHGPYQYRYKSRRVNGKVVTAYGGKAD
jgi:curved DNA-binding protein CbpA